MFALFAQVLAVFTCSEILDLLVFSLTLARTPLSPDDLSVISSAALSSLGVSGLGGAAGTWGGSLASSLGSGFFPLLSIFLWLRQKQSNKQANKYSII